MDFKDNEIVLMSIKHSPWILAYPIIGIILTCRIYIYPIFVLWLLYRILCLVFEKGIITDARICIKMGILFKKEYVVPIIVNKTITVKQDFLGGKLNYCRISLLSDGLVRDFFYADDFDELRKVLNDRSTAGFNVHKNQNAVIEPYRSDSEKIQECSFMLTEGIIKNAVSEIPYIFNNASQFASINRMTEKDIEKAHNNALHTITTYVESLGKSLSEQDMNKFISFVMQLNVKYDDKGKFKLLCQKNYDMGQALQGNLQPINKSHLHIAYKNDEELYYVGTAKYIKLRKQTKRVKYAGFTSSIRIWKGLRYRMGDLAVGRETEEFFDVEDVGRFYVTSRKIGFLGSRKQFSVDFSKMVNLQAGQDHLFIFKSGRENPYMIRLDDYDLPYFIISHLLNDL